MSNPSSTIIIYKDSKIIPARNMVVDSISDYLSNLTKITLTDFQYIRHHLEMEIKIDRSQIWQEFDITYNYNYVSIQNSDASKVVYYFIVGKRQVANSTIALSLRMDTANSFVYNTDFTPTARTKIEREHKDRMSVNLNKIYALKESSLPIYVSSWSNNSWIDSYLDISYNNNQDNIHLDIEVYWFYNALDPSTAEIRFRFKSNSDIKWIINHPDSIVQCIYGDDPDDGYYIEFTAPDFIQALSILGNGVHLLRKIDFFSENIDVNLYKSSENDLVHNEDDSWNLVYKNGASENDPIDCFLYPSNISVDFVQSTSNSLTYTSFVDGKYYFIAPCRGVASNWQWINSTLTDNDGNQYKSEMISGQGSYIIQIQRTGTTLQVRQLKVKGANSLRAEDRLYTGQWNTITSLSFETERLYYNVYDAVPVWINTNVIPTTYFEISGSSVSIDPLYKINRADPYLIKIITMPYYPSPYEWDADNSEITPLDGTWTPINGELKLNNLNSKFSSTIVSDVSNPLNVFSFDVIPNISDLRNDVYESKLYHSDYYRPKFVYDSFGFNFLLERIDETNFEETDFTFDFIMTSTINSKFMFRFPQYVLKMSEEDYDNILPIARNNEQPIYNSPYITYLRTAYRYDLKALDFNRVSTISSFITDYTNKVGSGIESGLKENWSAFAKTITNMPNSVIQTIMGLQNRYNSMDSHLAQLKAQSVSVSGSDDIDLLEAYSNNRAKLVVYEVVSRVKGLLADLFYYYGYRTEEMKIPSINTRLWFNYLKCELELSTTGNNLSEEVIEDIKLRYRSGITFFHKVNNTWDFDQVKENWEAILI